MPSFFSSFPRPLRLFLPLALRVFGLHLLPSLTSTWREPEPQKTAVRSSSPSIFIAFLAHVIPVSITIVLFSFNVPGWPVGPNLLHLGPHAWSDDVKLNALQVLAKLHELLIVASVASVVFHFTSKQLLRGNGLPLGLIGAGISFTQVSWFWSPDFWGGLMYPARSIVKIQLIGLLVLAGLIALLAGPSSAILMLPRLQHWSAAHEIFLPAQDYGFWYPGAVHWRPEISLCETEDDVFTDWCITAGHHKLLTLFANEPPRGRFDIPVPLTGGIARRNFTGYSRRVGVAKAESWTLVPHLATVYLQSAIFLQWASIYFYSKQRNHATELPSSPNQVIGMFPVVRTVCVPPKSMTYDTDSTLFPLLWGYDSYDWTDGELTYVTNDTISWNAPVAGEEIPLEIELLRGLIRRQSSDFTARSTWYYPSANEQVRGSACTMGLVIMMNSDTNGSEPALMGCSLSVGYAEGETSTEGSRYVLGESEIQTLNLEFSSTFALKNDDNRLDMEAAPYSNKWTSIYSDDSVLRHLSAYASDALGSDRANKIDEILETNLPIWFDVSSNEKLTGVDNYKSDMVGSIETLISTYVADGFARVGAHRVRELASFRPGGLKHEYGGLYNDWLNCNANQAGRHGGFGGTPCQLLPPVPPAEQLLGDSEYTPLKTTFSFNGYVYSLQGGSAFFAIAVLSLHMLLALYHVLDLLLINRWTVSCWDTLPELLALAQTSDPPKSCLQNTSTGVKRLRSYATVAKIGVVGNEMDSLELDELPSYELATRTEQGSHAGDPGRLRQRQQSGNGRQQIMFVFEPEQPTGKVAKDVKY